MLSPFGSFSKSVKGGLSLNFSTSGGRHCDPSCPLMSVCYAQGVERTYTTVNRQLVTREAVGGFTALLKDATTPKALAKMSSAPWFRFSVLGSIPDPRTWTKAQRKMLKTLADNVPHGLTHFPVETIRKARALINLGFSPRVSHGAHVEALRAGIPASVSVQLNRDNGAPVRIRACNKKKLAHQAHLKFRAMVAELEAKLGRRLHAKLCPAIIGNAKCGSCTMCANPEIDLIGYPIH